MRNTDQYNINIICYYSPSICISLQIETIQVPILGTHQHNITGNLWSSRTHDYYSLITLQNRRSSWGGGWGEWSVIRCAELKLMRFYTTVKQHISDLWIITLYKTVTANEGDRFLRNVCRLQLKCDDTRRRTRVEVKGGNWRMKWVACILHTTSELGVSSITTADAHTSAASRLN